MEKLKVYLKGFKQPYAVFGYRCFEDERFFVIQIEGSKRWIPWSNLLYIESLEAADEMLELEPEPSQSAAPPPTLPPNIAEKLEEALAVKGYASQKTPAIPDQRRQVTVNFTGHKQKTFSLEVPAKTLSSEKPSELSREIFGAPQIQAFMGDFVVKGSPRLDGDNVFIETVAPNQITKPDMMAVQEKLKTTQKFLSSVVSAKPSQVSLGLDSAFSMPGSPFTTPLNLQDIDEDQ